MFDSANESVLVPFEKGVKLIAALAPLRAAQDMAYAQELLNQAKSYTVSLPVQQIDRMIERNMVYTVLDGSIYVLKPGYYDDLLGIKEEE